MSATLGKVINRSLNLRSLRVLSAKNLSTNVVHRNILLSDSSDVDIPDVTIPEFILPKLEKYDIFSATECATTGRAFTFGQVRAKSKNLSKALRHIFKLKKGDVVALFLPNRPEFIFTVMGILEAGLVLTTLNPIYTAEEISRQLLDSSAKVLITQLPNINTAKASINLIKKNIPIISLKMRQNDSLPKGIINFEELVNTNFDLPDADYGKPGDLAFLPYSSGTTGMPKGVELTHKNLVSNLCQVKHKDFDYFDQPTDSAQDVTAAVLPFYHIYGFNLCLLNLASNGAKTVTLEKFTPETFISVLKRFPISIMYAAPPLVLFLISHPEVKREYFKHFKMITSGAAPLGFLDEERLLKKIGRELKVIQGYGLTEASPILTYSPIKLQRTEKVGGSVGKPLSNTMIKIISPDDPTGTPLGPNEIGELLAKGPQVMKGYHNREEETKNIFLDGWLRTGDIGYYNDDKMIFITDRIKELIKVKGYQVPPAELEEILRHHPAIEDAAVIGIPHEKYGEVPRAYVVPNKNVSLDFEDIKNYVASKVAPYKRLEGGIKILVTIPKNPSGKILRRKLKADFLERGV